MNISDIIFEAIMELINNQGGEAQIKRNELAVKFGCAPSQINYVITSRFTPEHGYIVESRRGGGGFIKIVKIKISRSKLIMHIVNSIGDSIDENSIRIILENLCYDNIINQREAKIILSALSDNVMREIEDNILRNRVRASMLKPMLLNCIC